MINGAIEMADEDWLTVIEAADLAGYHPNHIRRLIRSGEIKARKWGQLAWMVGRESLVSYLKLSESRGGRRGPKTGSRQTE